ncbi:MAG: NADH-ubiquinone/plastoquinone oxidoreductase chain 3 [Actinomycetota bacterium]|nr:MAG: NADH-ubiquinone/plastoquinone oxidoreductase chain 3 [Actinomycetota bacterium]
MVLATLFAGLSIIASVLMAPKKPNPAKSAPYECGIIPSFEPPERFPVRFYLVAMIFVVFDIEIIFIYPYAVISRSLGTFGVVEMLVFGATMFVAFLYLVSNGALNWGHIKRNRGEDNPFEERTTSSTIRRVSSKEKTAA